MNTDPVISSPDFLFADFLQQGCHSEGTDLKSTYTTQSKNRLGWKRP